MKLIMQVTLTDEIVSTQKKFDFNKDEADACESVFM